MTNWERRTEAATMALAYGLYRHAAGVWRKLDRALRTLGGAITGGKP